MIEKTLEKFLFASRWLLAPFYVALVLALALLMEKTLQEVWHFILNIPQATEAEVILAALSLLVASNLAALALCLALIFGGGYLFYRLVRVMARLQTPRREP